MSDLPVNSKESSVELEERLCLIEGALKLDERIKSLEETLISKDKTATANPWWRDSKTVTILGALLAAVIPLVTAIDGILKNARESQRALVEQQDKIRQTYLDRVLKPGITEIEQKRIFSLLAKLKSDSELQQWAQEEYGRATKELDALSQELASLEKHLEKQKEALDQLDTERHKKSSSPKNVKAPAPPRLQNLSREVAQSEQKVSELKQRKGETATPVKCECPSPPGGGIACPSNQRAICKVEDGRCTGQCLTLSEGNL